jgi:hypothetical protein
MSHQPFDPDRVASDFGEEHLIPRNVRPLTDAELRAMFPAEYRLLHGDGAAVGQAKSPPSPPSPPLAARLGRVLGGIEL